MSTRGSYVVSWLGASAVIALMLLCASSAAAQTVSPCCAKLCNADGSSTACKPMLLGGLGSGGALAQGCVDVETAPPGDICLGGSLLGGDPAGLISCICIFGGEGNPGQCSSGQDGSTLKPSECTIRSVAGCGENVVKIPNDPACVVGETCKVPGCCRSADGTCTDFSTAETCTGGSMFVAGHVCSEPDCKATCPIPVGTACDDNNPCTSGETIQSDCTCGGGTDNGTCCCQQFENHCFPGCNGCSGACAPGFCTEGPNNSSTCRTTPPECTSDVQCDDGNVCNGQETCVSGTCQPGTPVPNCCTTDAQCDDGNVCNGQETCVSNTCQPGTPVPNCCTSDTQCDDGLVCNGQETCVSNTCQPGTPVPNCCETSADCDDGTTCTDDVCTDHTCSNPDNGTCCCQQFEFHCNQGCGGCTEVCAPGQCVLQPQAPDGTFPSFCEANG